jgi:hypothetical protein
MSSGELLVGRIRDKLDAPSQEQIGDGKIASMMLEVIDELNTEFHLTKLGWNARKKPVTVAPGKDEYKLDLGDFGMASLVITRDQTDRNHNTRLIRIVNRPELYVYFGAGDRGPAGEKHSALACSFYNENKEDRVQFAPIPERVAEYLIFYKPDIDRPGSKEDQAFIEPEFDGYLSDRAAFKLLPYVHWFGSDKDALEPNAMKADSLRDTLIAEIKRGDNRFLRFKRTKFQSNSIERIAYGQHRWGRRTGGRRRSPIPD